MAAKVVVTEIVTDMVMAQLNRQGALVIIVGPLMAMEHLAKAALHIMKDLNSKLAKRQE